MKVYVSTSHAYTLFAWFIEKSQVEGIESKSYRSFVPVLHRVGFMEKSQVEGIERIGALMILLMEEQNAFGLHGVSDALYRAYDSLA